MRNATERGRRHSSIREQQHSRTKFNKVYVGFLQGKLRKDPERVKGLKKKDIYSWTKGIINDVNSSKTNLTDPV